MIVRRHNFNSEWWGGEVGIMNPESLDEFEDLEIIQEMDGYNWVELKLDGRNDLPTERLGRLGFEYFDTQIAFRVSLRGIDTSPSVDGIVVETASDRKFSIEPDEILDFSHDRFSRIHGCTARKARERYSMWGNNLIDSHPNFALKMTSSGIVQGYFIGCRNESGFELSLAMLGTKSNITGMHLYQRALKAYEEMGERVGKASFSVFNTPVLNIYSELN